MGTAFGGLVGFLKFRTQARFHERFIAFLGSALELFARKVFSNAARSAPGTVLAIGKIIPVESGVSKSASFRF
jgi:hypothetical protein